MRLGYYVVFFMIFVLAFQVQARTYKCVNKQGQVTFSQLQCAQSILTEGEVKERKEEGQRRKERMIEFKRDILVLQEEIEAITEQNKKKLQALESEYEEQKFRKVVAKNSIKKIDKKIKSEKSKLTKKVARLKKKIKKMRRKDS